MVDKSKAAILLKRYSVSKEESGSTTMSQSSGSRSAQSDSLLHLNRKFKGMKDVYK